MRQDQYDIAFVDLTIGHTNEELHDLMRGLREMRERGTRARIVAAIGGYDDDARELWEVPEVRAFCRRLFNVGFPSYLDAFGKNWLEGDNPAPFGLGAFEVWMIGEGRMRSEFTVTKELFDEFRIALGECNARSDAAIGPMRMAP